MPQNEQHEAIFNPTCPYGGQYYACPSTSTSKFIGCCGGIIDCQLGCSSDNLRATSFDTTQIDNFTDGICAPSSPTNSQFYKCAKTKPDGFSFLGCCAVDPCNGGCDQGNLFAAVAPSGTDGWAYGVDADADGDPAVASLESISASSVGPSTMSTTYIPVPTSTSPSASSPLEDFPVTTTQQISVAPLPAVVILPTAPTTLPSSTVDFTESALSSPSAARTETKTLVETAMPTATAAVGRMSSAVIGGSIAGGIFLLLPLVVYTAWHFWKKKRRGGRQAEMVEEEGVGTGSVEVAGEEQTEEVGAVIGDAEADTAGQVRRQSEVLEWTGEEMYHAR
ncbi:hypothetical protein FKW77_001997 [Venturia effusa]|uniref:Uncharacterized protein n=1 Tax=Venturia effusa TaxID=50376 RepID=A0A517L0T1_9PEZI|nr:hypothetical protein FKW77_001997 [Venturia effusa]